MMLPRLLLVAVMLAAGCSTPADSGAVTVSSLQSLEAGRTKAAAGDFAGAREAFAAAITGGGLQPDLYCEALLQQADCESRLGNHDAALALLDQLAQGAPDLGKVNAARTAVKARQTQPRTLERPAAESPTADKP
ncbi:MAG: hypothetical protein EBX35_03350 [Planctomycetia bacterium]|nr:hypothetical protein [Planctomycetia bacterium]